MTLYLDASNLVKLYIDEAGSDAVRSLVDRAEVVATSIVAYAEVRATFGRRRDEGVMTRAECRGAADRFDADWLRFAVIAVDDELGRAAGRLADAHRIRGCDALHLASFEFLLRRGCDDDDDVQFSCADERLSRAAASLG